MLITLNKEAAEKIKKLRLEHRDLGLKKKDWDQVVSEILLSTSVEELGRLASEKIPDEVVIQTALFDEELKRAVAEFVKKRSRKKPSEKIG